MRWIKYNTKIGCAASFMVLIRGVRIARTYQQNQPEGA